jgi:hypothetical protein
MEYLDLLPHNEAFRALFFGPKPELKHLALLGAFADCKMEIRRSDGSKSTTESPGQVPQTPSQSVAVASIKEPNCL